MARIRKKYLCRQCGYASLKWVGRCPNCSEWNSLLENTLVSSSPLGDLSQHRSLTSPQGIGDVSAATLTRYVTGSEEVNRVLGGGLVPGSLILLGGDPGIGKSTLLLQLAHQVAQQYGKVLYVSAEESVQQIALRAKRLGLGSNKLLLLGEADLRVAVDYMEHLDPIMVIIDSIQTVYCPEITLIPGSLGQVRESAAFLMKFAKNTDKIIWLVGHVTKEGAIAGPRVLEHMVDVVLYLEGESQYCFRVLRGVKNRFGPTDETGILEMHEQGLLDVVNPSACFLAERPAGVAGSVVVATMEGTRPLLVEIQALVVPSGFGQPRRSVTGADYNRVSLILAVLEKRVGLNILNQDVFVNVVGGVKVNEPAVDLGIAVALASSFKGIPAQEGYLVMGEIGLTGEIRSVSYVENRLREAMRLGFGPLVIPQGNVRSLEKFSKAMIIGVGTLVEALEVVLQR
ncbi:MAG: DNA repair protein RadA [Syntrophomonadaceae bacterium]|nr:DNA repair protein RadA [Syntrophomonadaceae bacterium]